METDFEAKLASEMGRMIESIAGATAAKPGS